jgi:hypothetical protein
LTTVAEAMQRSRQWDEGGTRGRDSFTNIGDPNKLPFAIESTIPLLKKKLAHLQTEFNYCKSSGRTMM